ncbi:MAG: hypothetical protein Kow0010_02510 [Dehalococcoidia bacterium]
MTLALYGKSRKRQGLLGLLAVLAVVLAIAAAGATRFTAWAQGDFAPTTTHNVVPTSQAFPGDRVCPSSYTLIQDKFPNPSPGDHQETYSVGGQDVTVKIKAYADKTFDFEVLDGLMGIVFVKAQDYLKYDYTGFTGGGVASDTGLHPDFNEQAQGGSGAYRDISHLDFCLTATQPETATIWIKKVQVGGVDNTTFTADIKRGGVAEGSSIDFSETNPPGPQEVTITDPAGANFTVSEQNPGTDWVVSWAVIDSADADCSQVTGWNQGLTASGGGLDTLQADDNVTVCFRNEFQQAADKGSITVCKIIKDEAGTIVDGSDVPGAQFSVTVRHNGTAIGTATFTAPIAQDDLGNGLKGECQLVAANLDQGTGYTYDQEVYPQDGAWLAPQYSDINATSFCEFSSNDDDCDGNIPINGTRLHRTVYVQNQYQTGDLVVVKVIVGDGGDPGDPFSGSVTGPYSFDESFNNLSVNSHIEHNGIPVGVYQVEEDDPAALGYALLGYTVHENVGEVFACPGTPAAGPASAQVNANQTTVVCVYNDPRGSLEIRKVLVGGGDPSQVFDGTLDKDSPVGFTFSANSPAVFDDLLLENVPFQVSEGDPTLLGYELLGYALAVNGICPAEPTQTDTNNPFPVVVDGPTPNQVVCVYNQPLGEQEEPLTPASVTAIKRFDTGTTAGAIDDGDAFISGWQMTLTCDGQAVQAGQTGAGGSISFAFADIDGPITCTLTEGTQALVAALGHSINGGALQGGTTASFQLNGDETVTVTFLNNPAELPPPPPPGTEGPIPGPQPQAPEEPTPAPTEPVQPTQEPQEPEPTETPAGQATPVAPDAGSGTALGGTRSAGSLWLAAVGLLAVSGAAGTLALARRKG